MVSDIKRVVEGIKKVMESEGDRPKDDDLLAIPPFLKKEMPTDPEELAAYNRRQQELADHSSGRKRQWAPIKPRPPKPVGKRVTKDLMLQPDKEPGPELHRHGRAIWNLVHGRGKITVRELAERLGEIITDTKQPPIRIISFWLPKLKQAGLIKVSDAYGRTQ